MRGRRVWAAKLAGIAGAWLGASVAAPPPGPDVLPGPAPEAGFAQALEVRTFVFPRDHGPHPEYRQEWWYVTGNLDSTSGERFGFELTFFRFALQPPAAAPDAAPAAAAAGAPLPGASAWRTHQIYMAHFAITDAARQHFQFTQKLSREALGLAGARTAPLRVWIDDWSLGAADAAATAGQAAPWTLKAAEPGYAIELTLAPERAPVLNGEDGLSRKSDTRADASYYYSMPRLSVRGRLLRGGEALDVSGLAWLDREWGSGGLGANEAGWDWFALQLSDGSSLMFYALRDKSGGRDVHSAGTWIPAGGAARELVSADVDIDVGAQWRNSAGERYPARWHIHVPKLALELDVRPVLADQELKTRPRYWEGAVDVRGEREGERVGGRGYVELVGYAR